MPAATQPAVPRPSASAVILRDNPAGIEIFMVVRHHEIDFASGAIVFPGGKLDPQDSAPDWAGLVSGTAPAPERAYYVAAARETFEEAGLLIARRHDGAALLAAEEAHRLVETRRASVAAGETTFASLLSAERLTLALDLMVPFAHFITPEALPKRYETHFFLVAAPVAQLGLHDGHESVEGLWIRPGRALEEARAGARTIVPATQLILERLAAHGTVADAVAATRATPVVSILPKVVRTETGRKVVIPPGLGYATTEIALPGR
ncbi:MAG: NUDIX domain-containing protein [Hyphomicrobiaceae bacterium]